MRRNINASDVVTGDEVWNGVRYIRVKDAYPHGRLITIKYDGDTTVMLNPTDKLTVRSA